MKSRILLVFSGLLILWGALVLRAGWLQVFPDARLKALQDRQFQTVVTLQNRRGPVVDQRGRDLALSMTAYSLYADPKILEQPKKLSRRLAKSLGMYPPTVFEKIKDPTKRFIWLARLLPKEKYDEIRAWDVRGLSFVEEYKRVYPNETLLSSSLGFVGNEGQGLEGLELQYNDILQGNKKKIAVRRDARGRPLTAQGMMFAENLEGSEIKLTVDYDIQHMLENELQQAAIEFEADQAFGVILQAQTSAVLAMGSSHSFDLNKALKAEADVRRNRAITDTFEPGSVIKAFAIAAALREKMVAPNTRIDTENGRMVIADRVIREADEKHKWDHLTVSEILAYSSNVGTTKIAFQVGPESLRKAFADFGFGAKSGIDLPGESRGNLQPLPWRPHLLANISFGQGIATTPLQIANAYAAIANGGVLREPYLVDSYRDLETGKIVQRKPKDIRRVLSEEDAAAMRMMLAGVTAPGGSGVSAKVDGFVVAGKTGTAQRVNPNGGGYQGGGYVSSFAGFIPANDPQYVIYVVVDRPKKKNTYYGSQIAAPLFSRVASYLVRKEGLAPLSLTEKNLVPRVKRELAGEREQEVQPLFSGLSKTAAEILMQEKPPSLESVPDLKGLTARQVLQRFSGQSVSVRMVGQGLVSETLPESGASMADVKKITVYLK